MPKDSSSGGVAAVSEGGVVGGGKRGSRWHSKHETESKGAGWREEMWRGRVEAVGEERVCIYIHISG